MSNAASGGIVRRLTRRRFPDGEGGFSLFELVIGITIISLLGAVLAERLLRYQEYAEKVAMEVTARNIQTGLRMRVADLMMSDRLNEIERLLHENPFAWLETPPPNYIGEHAGVVRSDSARGNWYFDTERRETVYIPFHRRFFEPQIPGVDSIRYRVSAITVPPGAASRRIEGLALRLLSPYRWEVQAEWSGM